MDKVIKFKKPAEESRCTHENISIKPSSQKCICVSCGADLDPYYILNWFSRLISDYDVVNKRQLDYMIESACFERGAERSKKVLEDLDQKIFEKFRELHALEVQIKEKKSQLSLI